MKKIVLTLTLAALLTASNSEAAKLDRYRQMLENNSVTIRYEIDQAPMREMSKEGKLTEKGLVANQNSIAFFENQPHAGIVVLDGENRYIEQSRNFVRELSYYAEKKKAEISDKIQIPERGLCKLVKDGEIFNFEYSVNKKNEKKYSDGDYFKSVWKMFSGSKTIESIDVDSDEANTYTAMIEEYYFGSKDLSKALLPILPPSRVIQTAFTPNYKYFDAGTLDNGTNYEDYVSNENGIFHAIRYYFDGDELKSAKIVAYANNLDGRTGYEKTIIKFTEFSATPDQSLLKLPDTLKAKSKKSEEESK
ncbi:MAG: hypothetical protein IJ575_04210 [Selenomonadaceae bacterium]|nr:hypothetical protein [Selenomonadaceae bacterium]